MKRRSKQNQPQRASTQQNGKTLLERAVERSLMTREAFTTAITQTAFQGLKVWSQADLERMLVAAERYGLNPLNREIFGLSSSSNPLDPILLVVGVDGWSKILNMHAEFDGMVFKESQTLIDNVPEWIECTIHRKDRSIPIAVKEFFHEVRGEHMSWLTHPRRMLRHKALVQCARLSFALSGIYDPDEAKSIQTAKQHHQSYKSRQSLKECLMSRASS